MIKGYKAILAAGSLFAVAATVASPAIAADGAALPAQTEKFREIYKQLVEINTSNSVGDNTKAAQAMRQRLLDAGFAAGDVQIVEPYPRKGNMVARWKGTGKAKPMLLLAHIDVVEARRSDWDTDPFVLQEKDGFFTARGSVDDKAMASIFVSVLAQLKAEGFKPKRDIILALTADEEQGSAPSNGAGWLLKNRPELVRAEFGINEGGRGEMQGGAPMAQIVQIGEKSFVRASFEVTGPGGHSARPTADNVIYDLLPALQRLQSYRFPVRMNEASRLYFQRSAALQTGQTAMDMASVGAGKADDAVYERLSQNPGVVGLLRTTCVATMLEAGHAENALPQKAKATINCRLLPDEDFAFVKSTLEEIGGAKVKVSVEQGSEPAPASALRPDVMKAIEEVSAKMWPGVPVIPTMGVSTTDSRFYRQAGMPMYGVSGIFADPAETRAHGLNERVGVKQLYDAREFMYRLVKMLSS